MFSVLRNYCLYGISTLEHVPAKPTKAGENALLMEHRMK